MGAVRISRDELGYVITIFALDDTDKFEKRERRLARIAMDTPKLVEYGRQEAAILYQRMNRKTKK